MAVYKQYYNAYEKKAEEIRRAAQAVENGTPQKENKEMDKNENNKEKQNTPPLLSKDIFGGLFERFATDDILLVALIFILLKSDNKDSTMLLILGYLLLCGN